MSLLTIVVSERALVRNPKHLGDGRVNLTFPYAAINIQIESGME
jgi:hypothetical protein